MGNASLKRKRRRMEYLQKLAEKDPKKFRSEWAKRLESWSSLVASQIAGEGVSSGPSVFDVIDSALVELTFCGPEAVVLEATDTKEHLIDACCRAVAQVVDPRIYRLVRKK